MSSLSMEMSRLIRDGTVEPVSRDQNLRRERGKGNTLFSCSADHEQDWQPYPMCVCVVITFILDVRFVDVPTGVTQEGGHTGFLHLPSAVLALTPLVLERA